MLYNMQDSRVSQSPPSSSFHLSSSSGFDFPENFRIWFSCWSGFYFPENFRILFSGGAYKNENFMDANLTDILGAKVDTLYCTFYNFMACENDEIGENGEDC